MLLTEWNEKAGRPDHIWPVQLQLS